MCSSTSTPGVTNEAFEITPVLQICDVVRDSKNMLLAPFTGHFTLKLSRNVADATYFAFYKNVATNTFF